MSGYNSILRDLKLVLNQIDIPIETGIFKGKAPEEYIVITPMNDIFALYADNLPQREIQEARISLFTKGNYLYKKNDITKLLMKYGFTITDRRYIGYEKNTGFYHYAIDVSMTYDIQN